MRHAIIRDGRVENVALWDGETEWSPPAGTQLVPAADDTSPGDTWDGTRFIKPPIEPPKKTRVDRIVELEARVAKLEARVQASSSSLPDALLPEAASQSSKEDAGAPLATAASPESTETNSRPRGP